MASGGERNVIGWLVRILVLFVAVIVAVARMCPIELIDVTFADGFKLRIPPQRSRQEIERVVREHQAISKKSLKTLYGPGPFVMEYQSADELVRHALRVPEEQRSRNIVCKLLRACGAF
jgi:hypothetical protein